MEKYVERTVTPDINDENGRPIYLPKDVLEAKKDLLVME